MLLISNYDEYELKIFVLY